jgi:hypothetical protein
MRFQAARKTIAGQAACQVLSLDAGSMDSLDGRLVNKEMDGVISRKASLGMLIGLTAIVVLIGCMMPRIPQPESCSRIEEVSSASPISAMLRPICLSP